MNRVWLRECFNGWGAKFQNMQKKQPDDSWNRAARRWAASAAPALAWAGVGVPFDVVRRDCTACALNHSAGFSVWWLHCQVRTRLQTTSTARFRSAWHCFEHTVRNEGIFALWKGLTPQVLISLPSSVLLFGTYQALRPERPQAAAAAVEWRSFYAGVFGAGFGSGVALTALQNPLDTDHSQAHVAIKLRGSRITSD